MSLYRTPLYRRCSAHLLYCRYPYTTLITRWWNYADPPLYITSALGGMVYLLVNEVGAYRVAVHMAVANQFHAKVGRDAGAGDRNWLLFSLMSVAVHHQRPGRHGLLPGQRGGYMWLCSTDRC